MPLARVVGLAGALLLVACGHSPSTQFYLLGAVRASPPLAHFAGSPVQLRAVHIPAVLDRVELVSALPGGRLQIDEFRQWGAPMADMIRNVLSEDLSARLPAGMVAPSQAPAPQGSRGIVVDVLEFQPEADGSVVLNAAWTLLAAGPSHPALSEQRRLQQSGVGASAGDRVEAMSQLLGQLADALAQSVRSAL
ncbi:MAG TPA: PqiC family protein [Steroidobacteraceae bacterium]|nr:PqiC family protein [Steroidobacteraceae bacterium]